MENEKPKPHPVPDIGTMIRELNQISRESEWHAYSRSYIPGYVDPRKEIRERNPPD